MTTTPVSLQHHFADLVDPRVERSRRQELLDIIAIAPCAVISGAESGIAVEAYGHAKHDGLARSFHRPHGIPSHDTVRGVFCLLDPEAFQRCFAARVAALAERGVGSRLTIPIDGKTVRRSGRRGYGLAPLHLVGAWAGVPTTSAWARWRWTTSPTRSPRSRACGSCSTSRAPW